MERAIQEAMADLDYAATAAVIPQIKSNLSNINNNNNISNLNNNRTNNNNNSSKCRNKYQTSATSLSSSANTTTLSSTTSFSIQQANQRSKPIKIAPAPPQKSKQNK